jgi:hypothetical protein
MTTLAAVVVEESPPFSFAALILAARAASMIFASLSFAS